MKITIKEVKDAALVARLNQTVQDIHLKEYPRYFKPHQANEVEIFFASVLQKENWLCYAAYDVQVPVGYILLNIRDYSENPFRYAYQGLSIDQISVLPEYQGQNIGSMLMQKAEEITKARGLAQIELSFWEKNIHAKQFYAKQGFCINIHYAVKRF